MKAHKVVRRRCSLVLYTCHSKAEVRLWALCAGLPPFIPRKIPGTHFGQTPSRIQSYNAAGSIRTTKTFNHLFRNRTRDLPSCSVMPQPIHYRVLSTANDMVRLYGILVLSIICYYLLLTNRNGFMMAARTVSRRSLALVCLRLGCTAYI
jgi:hypothetical protein